MRDLARARARAPRLSAPVLTPPSIAHYARPPLLRPTRVADVVPTFVALVVLRKRTLPCTCCGLLSPPRTLDRSAAELHQQLIFSPSSLSRASAGGAGTSDGSESGGGRKDSSGGEM